MILNASEKSKLKKSAIAGNNDKTGGIRKMVMNLLYVYFIHAHLLREIIQIVLTVK